MDLKKKPAPTMKKIRMLTTKPQRSRRDTKKGQMRMTRQNPPWSTYLVFLHVPTSVYILGPSTVWSCLLRARLLLVNHKIFSSCFFVSFVSSCLRVFVVRSLVVRSSIFSLVATTREVRDVCQWLLRYNSRLPSLRSANATRQELRTRGH